MATDGVVRSGGGGGTLLASVGGVGEVRGGEGRVLAGGGGHDSVVGEVGDAGDGDLVLPRAEEFLQHRLLDADLVKVGTDVLDD